MILGENKMKKYAFTMAEVISVLVILGIVAIITIPNIYKKVTEKVKKVKIEKALSVYHSAISEISHVNRKYTADDLNAYINSDGNCTKAYEYFKVVQKDGCQFMTADKLWWDIGQNGSITKTIVAFNKKDLTAEKAYDLNSYKAFVFTAGVYNDSLVIVDPESGRNSGNFLMWIMSQKVYDYLNNTESGIKYCPIGASAEERKGCLFLSGSENADCTTRDERGNISRNRCIYSYKDADGKTAYVFENCGPGFNCDYVYKTVDVEDSTGEYKKITQRTICDKYADCSNPISYARQDTVKIDGNTTDFGGAKLTNEFNWYSKTDETFKNGDRSSVFQDYQVTDANIKNATGIITLVYSETTSGQQKLELRDGTGTINSIICKDGKCTAEHGGKEHSLEIDGTNKYLNYYKCLMEVKSSVKEAETTCSY